MRDNGVPHLAQMSEEQLKAFLEKVKTDAGLQEQLNDADADAVVEIAKNAGFVISAEELSKAHAEISDEELEGVAVCVVGGFNRFGQGSLLSQY